MSKKSIKKILIFPVIFILAFSLNGIPVSAKSETVIIGGEVFGLKLYCKGVMVTGFEKFVSNGENVCPAKNSGIKENDTITKINGKAISSNEELEESVKKSNGKDLSLEIHRDENNININVTPLKNSDNEYCLGMWVRDSCAGIGTITYYNPNDNTFGALGHGICDIDTGGLMISDNIQILSANVSSVSKSDYDSIGTLNGYFTSNLLANVGYNNDLGVYGKIITAPVKEKFKTAESQEIQTGDATIYSTVSGSEPKEYEITITEICNYDENTNKNFIFKVTDEELISATGGIVQGMSGSPIVQNGKIIGAVTHVLVNDPTKGYGIQIENMLNSAENLN